MYVNHLLGLGKHIFLGFKLPVLLPWRRLTSRQKYPYFVAAKIAGHRNKTFSGTTSRRELAGEQQPSPPGGSREITEDNIEHEVRWCWIISQLEGRLKQLDTAPQISKQHAGCQYCTLKELSRWHSQHSHGVSGPDLNAFSASSGSTEIGTQSLSSFAVFWTVNWRARSHGWHRFAALRVSWLTLLQGN